MPSDIADDLQSMSFGSSELSGSSAVSALSFGPASSSFSSYASSSSGPISKPHHHHPAAGDPVVEAIRRLRSESGAGGGGNLAISDLRFLRRLGSGDIGSVYLVEVKGCAAGVALAAKVMDKKELEGRNKDGRARTEREILEALDHPFLPQLYGVAESERWSCLLTEFCPGGDLHLLRQRQPGRRFDEAAVRFYASEVVAALEYVHMMDVVYRDLKPENVLVRSDGHIMLTDFDLSLKCDPTASTPAQIISNEYALPLPTFSSAAATGNEFSSCILPSCIVPTVSCFNRGANNRRGNKKKKPGRHGVPGVEFVAEPVDLRSMSFVGTHEYLAPEIVSGEGHGSTVDWWTLGIFVFELLYGATPFRGADHEMTLANIVARALEFPKEPTISAAAKDLISSLLVKDPARRLGATMGASAIKRHHFFSGVNWALLRCATPPYVPSAVSIAESVDMSEDCCPGAPMDYF